MRAKIGILIFIVLAASFYFFWNHQRKRIKPGSYRAHNIVLITVDTLRADHLPAYGYTQIRTPAIDRLAAESILFEDAVAHVPMTLPSHASILTGLLPGSHRVHDNAGFFLDSQIKTLPEILRDHGYKTAAFVSAFVLDSQFKLDQGFDLYSDDFALAESRVSSMELYRRAGDTQIEVESWLKKNKEQKFFLWVHYYDPHDPYEPPKPYDTEYAKSLYDGEIAYTDEIVRKLLASLETAGLNEKTIVVFTSDHGEGLGEHNEKTHSLFVYNATQHVPLMFRVPKTAPRRLKQIVGHIDIAPTILDLIGIAASVPMDGTSLLSVFNGDTDPSRIAYSESLLAQLHYGWSPLKSITSTDYKFIEAPRAELYDRQTDRAETKNLATAKPDIVRAFREKLSAMQPTQEPVAPGKVDTETEEKLRALGYIGTVVDSTPESRNTDPKDKIAVLNTISDASRAMDTKNYSLVIDKLRGIVQKEPQLVDARYILANAYLHVGDKELALQEFLNITKLNPAHEQTLYNLGYFYQTEGNPTASEYWYKKLLQQQPEHLFGNLNLASLYYQSGQNEKAKQYVAKIINNYEQSIRQATSPEVRSKLLEKLSEIRFKTGDPQQSMKDLEESTKIDPKNYKAWWKLGSLYQQERRLQDAIDCHQKSIIANKEFYPAYFSLSGLYLVTNTNLQEALRLVETAQAKQPGKQAEQLRAAIRAKLKMKK